MRIDLPRSVGTDEWYVDEATLLSGVAPHLASVATFALCKPTMYSTSEYLVLNVETGFSAARGYDAADAIALAKARLDRFTPEQFEREVYGALAKWARA